MVINQDDMSNLDLSKVAALHQKRTLAFVNHFVSTNIQFLNSFMKKCELKLINFERKLEKVEASIILLEARLSSIPEVSHLTTETLPKPVGALIEQSMSMTSKGENESIDTDNNIAVNKTESVDDLAQVPPEYEKFVKMVQVGVPTQAVKLKASLEGLDPDILIKILGI